MNETRTHLVGVISDTHGELPAAAIAALQGVEQIIHAGDFDNPEILAQLQQIAPVSAVRGNMDRGPWSRSLPVSTVVQIGEAQIYVLHSLEELDLNPAAAGFQGLIYGHSHRPEITDRSGVLFLNPGSAGWPRHGFPPSVALLRVTGLQLQAELINFKEEF